MLHSARVDVFKLVGKEEYILKTNITNIAPKGNQNKKGYLSTATLFFIYGKTILFNCIFSANIKVGILQNMVIKHSVATAV